MAGARTLVPRPVEASASIAGSGRGLYNAGVAAPLWVPSAGRIASANLTAFISRIRQDWDASIPDYAALYAFSVARPEAFWRTMWEFGGVRGVMGERAVEHLDAMPGARFFPDARLNFAENLLRRDGDDPALIFTSEAGFRWTVTWAELRRDVARFAAALRTAGVGRSDRVAGYLPNLPQTIVAALGSAAIGAVWSSCSPDFGVPGVLDRFGQIEPRVLVSADGYFYGGRTHDMLGKVEEIRRALPTVTHTVIVPYVTTHPAMDRLPGAHSWPDFLAPQPDVLRFEPLPFDHPLYILYSSGTTGVPKCIVHGAGGTLIEHLKELQLHADIRARDRVFYFTTCGWMMWNWLVSALALEATLLLYDGSPFHPHPAVLFDLADATGMTMFGTSAKYIDAVRKAGLRPVETHDLGSVRAITSTGSPLVPESFDFVYADIKRDVHLASVSGGTDIVGCFVGGNPIAPVWRGEIQTRGLAMKVDVFDEAGRPLRQEKGELVCRMPFPSMPVGFWNDPDGRRYRETYFSTYPGVWAHGDYAELTEHDGVIIYGRSDATLNPGGVRIGTAEIYRQVERLDEVVESLVVGQQWEQDERVVLFVRLREGEVLTDELRDRIRRHVRDHASPRHVPARIVQVPEIPRTKSGKIVELAVREVVHGRPVRNTEALANPEALAHFRDREELRS
jgi:acetoacetyl-CoA synthetase